MKAAKNAPLPSPCGVPAPRRRRSDGTLLPERLTLAGGQQVTLRPVRSDDLDGLRRFIAGLSPRSRLLRFHGVVNLLPVPVLEAMTRPDPARELVLVAEALTHDGVPVLVAEARSVADGQGGAEFAVAVADAWHRRGLGRAMLQRLGADARQRGLRTLHGSVMSGNEPMLALMREMGAETRLDFDDASTVVAQMPV